MPLSDTQRRVLEALNEGYVMVSHTAWGDNMDHKSYLRRPEATENSIRVRYPTFYKLITSGYLRTIAEDPSGHGYTISEAGRRAIEEAV